MYKYFKDLCAVLGLIFISVCTIKKTRRQCTFVLYIVDIIDSITFFIFNVVVNEFFW